VEAVKSSKTAVPCDEAV
jgi:hypothetical protein